MARSTVTEAMFLKYEADFLNLSYYMKCSVKQIDISELWWNVEKKQVSGKLYYYYTFFRF